MNLSKIVISLALVITANVTIAETLNVRAIGTWGYTDQGNLYLVDKQGHEYIAELTCNVINAVNASTPALKFNTSRVKENTLVRVNGTRCHVTAIAQHTSSQYLAHATE